MNLRLRCILLSCCAAWALNAQDPFEIQAYPYMTVPKGMWNLETHVNYVGRGTKQFDGTVAPTHNQLHLTYELTHGITDYFELAGYLGYGPATRTQSSDHRLCSVASAPPLQAAGLLELAYEF